MASQLLLLVVLLGAGTFLVAYGGWHASPPTQNVPRPLTVGGAEEEKAGNGIDYEGMLAVNDLEIRSIGKWASELLELRPQQDVLMTVATNWRPGIGGGVTEPYVGCGATGYPFLVACSGGRKADVNLLDCSSEASCDFRGALPSGPPAYSEPVCVASVRPQPFPFTPLRNHNPIVYAYCAKSRFFEGDP